MEHNQQGSGQGQGGRRGHFRGRRGHDRRGGSGGGGHERRPSHGQDAQAPRGEHVDVEQIMRDIRARISERHGIDLTTPQIHELAARRLEAILDPRNVNPTLLEQLRKSAGAHSPVKAAPVTEPPYTFEADTLYESSRGPLGAIRKLLNPILKLFFNPNPLIRALNIQTRLNAEQAAREVERDERQAEWNALHYELIRRVVTENARLSLEVQALALRVESLNGRVDFADRRVRTLEATPAPRQSAQGGSYRQAPVATPVQASQDLPAAGTVLTPASGDGVPGTVASGEGGTTEGQRRRRRRRRGRRGNGSFGDSGGAPQQESAGGQTESEEFDDDQGDDSAGNSSESSAPVEQASPVATPVTHHESASAEPGTDAAPTRDAQEPPDTTA